MNIADLIGQPTAKDKRDLAQEFIRRRLETRIEELKVREHALERIFNPYYLTEDDEHKELQAQYEAARLRRRDDGFSNLLTEAGVKYVKSGYSNRESRFHIILGDHKAYVDSTEYTNLADATEAEAEVIKVYEALKDEYANVRSERNKLKEILKASKTRLKASFIAELLCQSDEGREAIAALDKFAGGVINSIKGDTK